MLRFFFIFSLNMDKVDHDRDDEAGDHIKAGRAVYTAEVTSFR